MRRSRSTRPRDRGRRALLRAVSWALAAFGAACLALTVVAIAIGARPLVVRTGSMAPSMPIGTVAIVKTEPATDASPGQVVAVVRTDGRRIMHRVQSVRPAGDGAVTIVLKGDRNRRADPGLTVSRVERPVVVVPLIGKPIGWLDNPWLQYWLGVLTGTIALAWFVDRRRKRGGGAAGTPAGEPS